MVYHIYSTSSRIYAHVSCDMMTLIGRGDTCARVHILVEICDESVQVLHALFLAVTADLFVSRRKAMRWEKVLCDALNV